MRLIHATAEAIDVQKKEAQQAEQRVFVKKGSTMYEFDSDSSSCRSPASHHNLAAIHNGSTSCIRLSLFDKNCQSNAFIHDPSLQRSFMAGPCQRWTATFAL